MTIGFDLRALYDALDDKRAAENLTWKAVTVRVNRHRTPLRPIAQSTITSLKTKSLGEGDAILQMLLWLGRTPESFVDWCGNADADRYQLPRLARGQILRWDTKALYAALDRRRRERGLTWSEVASEVGFTSNMLTNLARGPRIGFPRVMRAVRWLDQPAVTFTRIEHW